MIDDKIKLEDYFQNEIKRVSDVEVMQIQDEINEIKEKSIEGVELEASKEAGLQREVEMKEMQSEHDIALSRIHEESTRKLMNKRQTLSEEVFVEAREKLISFTEKKDYVEFLVKKAKELAEHNFPNVVFYVSKKDEKHLKAICDAYGSSCEGAVDERITIGGFRMECAAEGIDADETFDTGLEEQRGWFYTNSGLFIK